MSRTSSKKNILKAPQNTSNLVDISLLTCSLVKPIIFERCLKSIVDEMPSVPSRLIVLQNGPVKEKYAYDNLPPLTRLTSSAQMLGFPAGANRVIRSGHAPLVLFIHDDIILKPGALDALVRRMDDPTIGICGLKLIFPDDSNESGPAGTVQHVGHGISIRGVITHPFLGWSVDNPKCCVSREVASVTGGCFMVRRSVFEKAGGFFEGYGTGYFEDVDLCFTIAKLKYKIFIDVDAQAIHYVGSSMRQVKRPPLQFNEMILHTRHPDGFSWSEYSMY
jgi:GT2 family glycosyltransferase